MKKILSVLIVLSCIMSSIGVVTVQGAMSEESTCKEYVIITEDNYSAEEIADSYEGEVVESEQSVCVATLSSYEAYVVEKTEDVICVDENTLLTACENTNFGVDDVLEAYDEYQWNLDAIGIDETVEIENAQEVNVAVLDSGVAWSEDMNVKKRIDLTTNTPVNPIFADATGHGTALAGVIASSQNDIGISGISPNVNLYSVQVLDESNTGKLSTIIEGIYWCINNDIDIINMSFGTTANSASLYEAIKAAYEAGILMIASAGNTAHQEVLYPAAYNEVLSVGSVDSDGTLSETTSVGTNLDILAPGEQILSNDYFGYLQVVSGTSIATAQVTGVAALLLSVDNTKSPDFIKALLCESAKQCADYNEVGVIDFNYAYENYESFSENYTETQGETNLIETNTDVMSDYTEESEVLVSALWKSDNNNNGKNDYDGHHTLVQNNTGAKEKLTLTYDERQLMLYAARSVDAFYGGGSSNSVSGLHGTANYVYCLKFLFETATAIGNIPSVSGESEDTIRKKAKAVVAEKRNKYETIYTGITTTAPTYQGLFVFAEKVVDEARTNSCGIYPVTGGSYQSGATPALSYKNIKAMLVGVALHLAGDIYAHKTIVPKYTIAGTNPYYPTYNNYHGDMFGGKNFPECTNFDASTVDLEALKLCARNNSLSSNPEFKNWQHFQLAVAYQCIEFRDINMFLAPSYAGANNPYEDDARFCNERYFAANSVTRKLIYRANNNADFHIGLIFPKYLSEDVNSTNNQRLKYIKLNNFETFTSVSKLTMYSEYITEDDWAIHSTDSYV